MRGFGKSVTHTEYWLAMESKRFIGVQNNKHFMLQIKYASMKLFVPYLL